MKWTAGLGFIKDSLVGAGEGGSRKIDSLEKNFLPDRRYWLRFMSDPVSPTAMLYIGSLFLIQMLFILQRHTEPSNTDVCNFSRHSFTQQEMQTLKFN